MIVPYLETVDEFAPPPIIRLIANFFSLSAEAKELRFIRPHIDPDIQVDVNPRSEGFNPSELPAAFP